MPDINPLTNNQIFLKKIAENTGSDYETGDVSEINPLTIDQILLKEIAANTAGQSGDITELEGKVADNTAAIEAIENVLGAKNLLPVTLSNLKANNTLGAWDKNIYTYRGVTFTCTANGDIVTSITMNGTANTDGDSMLGIPMACRAGKWLANGGTADSSSSTFGAFIYVSSGVYPYVTDEDVEINLNSDTTIEYVIYTRTGKACSNVTFYPMIRDARITDGTYVPYAMTNRELTERVTPISVSVTDNNETWEQLLARLYASVDWSKVTPNSYIYEVPSGTGYRSIYRIQYYAPLAGTGVNYINAGVSNEGSTIWRFSMYPSYIYDKSVGSVRTDMSNQSAGGSTLVLVY